MAKMAASEFKAKCLGVLDEVARTGEPVVILKRGRPIAELIPVFDPDRGAFPQDALQGSVEIVGDIVAPPLPEEAWEALRADR